MKKNGLNGKMSIIKNRILRNSINLECSSSSKSSSIENEYELANKEESGY